MKRNKFKLVLLISLTIFFSGFSAIYLYNNINLMKDHVVEDLECFSEELKISAWEWTTTEVVSTESTNDSVAATIAVDGSETCTLHGMILRIIAVREWIVIIFISAGTRQRQLGPRPRWSPRKALVNLGFQQ